MTSYIEKVEAEITERLKFIETTDIRVHMSPESDAERPDPSSKRCNIFVMYTGSRYGEPRSTCDISQDEFFQVAVVIETPFLRGDFGVYQVKKKVIDCLLGFEPSSANKLTVVSAGYNAEKMSQDSGVFTFPVVFETRGLAIQVNDFSNDPEIFVSNITINTPKLLQKNDGGPFVATEDETVFIDDDNYPIK